MKMGRIRPIFMSTMTTVLGMTPLILFAGAGSELYRGLGSVVVGGLLVSTVFTLFLVPMLFSLTFELREKVSEFGWLRRLVGAGVRVPAVQVATAGAPLPTVAEDYGTQSRAVKPSPSKPQADDDD